MFYKTTTLTVITPRNCEAWLQHMSQHSTTTLWTWFSGSSRLAATMAATPFLQPVLPPIDLRYGWNVNDSRHQRLLNLLDDTFKPFFTTYEPRCRAWSVAGVSRGHDKTQRLRQEEHHMLTYTATRIQHNIDTQRHALVESPKSSSIFTDSPLKTVLAKTTWHETAMCQFSPEPDGERSLKMTGLQCSMQLQRCIKQ